MEALFGRDGSVVGWLHPENVIVDRAPQCRAFVQGDSIFSMDGRYLGAFRSGFLRDAVGAAVAFVRGASGGPSKPATKLPPLPPLVRVPRARHVSRFASSAPAASDEWSHHTFDAFLNGEPCARFA